LLGSWVGVLLGLVVALAGCSGGDPVERPPGVAAPGTFRRRRRPGFDAPTITQQQLVRSVLDGTAVEGCRCGVDRSRRARRRTGRILRIRRRGPPGRRRSGQRPRERSWATTAQLAALEHLVRLKVSSGDVGNPEIAALIGMTQLRELALRNTKIDAAD
jgi:hypothetical protein